MTIAPQPARRYFAVVDWENGQIEVVDSLLPFKLSGIASTRGGTLKAGQVVSLHDTREEAESEAERRRTGT